MCFAFLGPWGSNVAPWCSIVAPCAPFWVSWATCCRFSTLFLALGLNFDTPWLHLGTLWRPFWCLFKTLGRDPGPFGDFFGKVMKKVHKSGEKGSRNGCIFNGISSFREHGNISFDFAGASGLGFTAFIFYFVDSNFPIPFLDRFSWFLYPPGAQVGGRGGTPYETLIERI